MCTHVCCPSQASLQLYIHAYIHTRVHTYVLEEQTASQSAYIFIYPKKFYTHTRITLHAFKGSSTSSHGHQAFTTLLTYALKEYKSVQYLLIAELSQPYLHICTSKLKLRMPQCSYTCVLQMLFKSKELPFATQWAIKLAALAVWGAATFWWLTGMSVCLSVCLPACLCDV